MDDKESKVTENAVTENEVAAARAVPGEPRSFAVNNPVRPVISRAVTTTLIAAVVFELYAYLTKFTVRSIYVHTPWMNDPYDTFVTFAVFFVPLAFGVTVIRVPLCRRDQPLPIERARDLLRCGRLILVVILGTVIAQWVAVPLRANRASWNGATAVAIGLLAFVSVVTAVATGCVVRASPKIPRRGHDATAPDWLGDLLLTVKQESRRLGPAGKNADGLTRWLEERVLARVRRHPLLAGAILAGLFGLAFATTQATGEDIPLGQVFVFYFTAGACTMYAFLVIGGRYLDLVRSDQPSTGVTRRFYDCLVMGCAAIPAAVAFRFSLWGAVGARGESMEQIWVLFLIAFAATIVVSFAIETFAGLHRARAQRTP